VKNKNEKKKGETPKQSKNVAPWASVPSSDGPSLYDIQKEEEAQRKKHGNVSNGITEKEKEDLNLGNEDSELEKEFNKRPQRLLKKSTTPSDILRKPNLGSDEFPTLGQDFPNSGSGQKLSKSGPGNSRKQTHKNTVHEKKQILTSDSPKLETEILKSEKRKRNQAVDPVLGFNVDLRREYNIGVEDED